MNPYGTIKASKIVEINGVKIKETYAHYGYSVKVTVDGKAKTFRSFDEAAGYHAESVVVSHAIAQAKYMFN